MSEAIHQPHPLHGDSPRRGAQPVPRGFSRPLRHRLIQKLNFNGGLMPCSNDSSTDSAHNALRNGSTNAPCGSSTSRKRMGDSSTGKPGTSITARAVDWLLVGVFVFALWAAAVVWLTAAV